MADVTMPFHEAAVFLNISDAYLHQLVDWNELPAICAGEQHSMRVADLITYDRQRQDMQRRAIAEIAQLSQDCGTYN